MPVRQFQTIAVALMFGMLGLIPDLVLAADAPAEAPSVAPSPAESMPTGPRVAMETSEGTIILVLDREHAPKSVENFLRYVREKHYNGTIFHRVINGFMIQGGGLEPSMKERPTHPPIINEAGNGLKNAVGTIAMARETTVNSATAQFYINVADNEFLDHVAVPPEGLTINRRGKDVVLTPADAPRVFGYAVFGRVESGMDVVEKIKAMPTHTVGEAENVPVQPVVIKSVTLLN